jgi:hypothetical protein
MTGGVLQTVDRRRTRRPADRSLPAGARRDLEASRDRTSRAAVPAVLAVAAG